MRPTVEQEKLLHRLAYTLDEYLDAVPRQNEPDPPDLLAIFARINALEAELNASYPEMLRHYMHKKSYRKAHLFLKGRDAENLRNTCGKHIDIPARDR